MRCVVGCPLGAALENASLRVFGCLYVRFAVTVRECALHHSKNEGVALLALVNANKKNPDPVNLAGVAAGMSRLASVGNGATHKRGARVGA